MYHKSKIKEGRGVGRGSKSTLGGNILQIQGKQLGFNTGKKRGSDHEAGRNLPTSAISGNEKKEGGKAERRKRDCVGS